MDFVETHKGIMAMTNQFIAEQQPTTSETIFRYDLYEYLISKIPEQDVDRVLDVVGEDKFFEDAWEEAKYKWGAF